MSHAEPITPGVNYGHACLILYGLMWCWGHNHINNWIKCFCWVDENTSLQWNWVIFFKVQYQVEPWILEKVAKCKSIPEPFQSIDFQIYPSRAKKKEKEIEWLNSWKFKTETTQKGNIKSNDLWTHPTSLSFLSGRMDGWKGELNVTFAQASDIVIAWS